MDHIEPYIDLMKPYFSKQNFTLFQGDCLEVLKKMKPESVDMIFADPPYNLSNGGFTCSGGKAVSVNKGDWDRSKGFDADALFNEAWLNACRRVLKPGGTIWVSGTYHNVYQVGYALQKLGYHILNEVCWFKPNASPNLSCRMLTASHETVIWARRDKKAKHYFDYRFTKEYFSRLDSIKKEGLQMRDVWELGDSELPNVWRIPLTPKSEKCAGKHPTQKPVELLKRIINIASKPGDTILDPFNGSGTTGIVACALSRKYVGIDTENEYLDLTVKRFRMTTSFFAGQEKIKQAA